MCTRHDGERVRWWYRWCSVMRSETRHEMNIIWRQDVWFYTFRMYIFSSVSPLEHIEIIFMCFRRLQWLVSASVLGCTGILESFFRWFVTSVSRNIGKWRIISEQNWSCTLRIFSNVTRYRTWCVDPFLILSRLFFFFQLFEYFQILFNCDVCFFE